jgi:hypothetical protein
MEKARKRARQLKRKGGGEERRGEHREKRKAETKRSS